MSNYSIKINLVKLDGASLQTNAQGKMAVVIPVEEADLFVGQNGAVYLDLSMWETRGNPYGDTHSIKKSYSKARREMLGPDVLRSKPYIGNAKEMVPQGGNAQSGMMQAQPPAGFSVPSDNNGIVF